MTEIKKQFENAVLSGATDKVKGSVSSTGVRDSLSHSIINTVIELGKQLRKRGLTQTTRAMQESEIKATLESKLANLLNGKDLNEMINPLLGMKHKKHCSLH